MLAFFGFGLALAWATPVLACGGGGITSSETGVVANAQRIVLALHTDAAGLATTEIVVQIGVPETSSDYGVLIPVPSEPTLDSEPVSSADLDQLDLATRPTIFREDAASDSGGSGCGCASVKNGDDDSAGSSKGSSDVVVSAPVNIGPVTAVVLQTSDAAALSAWLDANGFVIPPEHADLVAAYVAKERYFIALRRNDGSTNGGPTSIGLHYTLTGDHRELTLGFARLGAASRMAFTVFVAGPSFVAPADPFTDLTLLELDADLLRTSYAGAVEEAVAQRGSHAFVLESTKWPPLFPPLSDHLREILGENNAVTRASTIVAADALDLDVRFDVPRTPVSNERWLSSPRMLTRESSTGVLSLVFLVRALRRRLRKT